MKTVGLLLAMLMVSDFAFAGSANIVLACKGRDATTLTGNVPGDESGFDVTVKMKGKSSRIYAVVGSTGEISENGTVTAVTELDEGVFTVVLNRKADDGIVQLYAIPKTVKYKKTANGYSSTFSGQLFFLLDDVAIDAESMQVDCTATYQI